MPKKDYSAHLEAGGFIVTILGAMILGISVGLGLGAYMVQRRFACGAGIVGEADWLFVNVTRACSDVMAPMNSMVLASALGGTVAFGCGLAVMVYAKRDGDDDA